MQVYRTMFENAGKPRVGDKFCELGVRPPGRLKPNGQPAVADVDLDSAGNVILNGKGMSVFRSLGDLLQRSRLVPIALAGKVRGAAGPKGSRIWTMGQGAFVSGPVTNALELHQSGGPHGTISPSTVMSLHSYQTELAATQTLWIIDEP